MIQFRSVESISGIPWVSPLKGLVYCPAILANGIFFWSDIEAFPAQTDLCDVRVQAKTP